MSSNFKSYFYALFAVLLWSTVATAFKFSLTNYNFIQVLFISSLSATFFLLLINLYQKNFRELKFANRKSFLFIVFAGILNPFMYYLILFKAYSLLPAQIAQSLNYTWPIVLVILSSIIHKYALKTKTYFSLFIGFIGVLVISFKGSFTFSEDISILGVLLATGSSIIWSLFWILSSEIKIKTELKLFLSFFVGSIFITITMFIFSNLPNFKLVSFFSAIYAGLFEMSITFIIWNKALEFTKRAENISNIVFLSPFLSLFFISFFLHEKILLSTFAGLLIIILSIIISKINFSKRSKLKNESN
jgi:drug/metabolite transporter (DMT)-like permease